MLTTVEAYDEAALAALIASAVLLGSDLKMGLNTAIVSPSKTLTIGDMVEPTYAGYARQLLVAGAPFRDPAVEISCLFGGLTWQQLSTPTPCLIQGYFIIGGTASAVFYGYEPLPSPFQMNDDLDAFTIILQYIQSSTNQGFSTVIS